jgi:hypothetical protein
MSSKNTSSLSNTLDLIEDKINFDFGLVLIIFGVTGTFLNILLFSRRRFRTVSCCICRSSFYSYYISLQIDKMFPLL